MKIIARKIRNNSFKFFLITIIFFIEIITINNQNANAHPFPVNQSNIPDGLGVNIHFTHPKPGEFSQLANAGIRWIRMDLDWSQTELKRGLYDFTAYEHLIAVSKSYKIKVLFILAYSNSLYDEGLSPYTDEGRKAFSNWVTAAVKKFRENGILWEMYNEPNNNGFWRPEPNVGNYILLAKAVGNAIRSVSSSEVYIGPAVARIDLPFLETCFKANLLTQWSAVSVHPYRSEMPETVISEYHQLNKLIKKYAPDRKYIPIISGEWGYTSQETGVNIQAKYLTRQWLINLSNNIPLSIWYDWRDDGLDPKNGEHNFGMVYHSYNTKIGTPYKVKPAYIASQTLISNLKGFQFYKRLNSVPNDNYILFFRKANKLVIAAWTTSSKPRRLTIPVDGKKFKIVNHIGIEEGVVQSEKEGLSITLTDSPKYYVYLETIRE